VKPEKASGRELKRKVSDLLRSTTTENWLEELNHFPSSMVVNSLISLLSAMDQGVKWKAIRAMGIVVERIARNDMEYARNIIRRLMWSLNEESGGI